MDEISYDEIVQNLAQIIKKLNSIERKLQSISEVRLSIIIIIKIINLIKLN